MFQHTILVTPMRISRAYAVRTSLLPTSRWLHASPIVSKTPTEKVTEVADKVNKSVGRGLASAIETGEQVTEKTKETFGTTKDRTLEGAETITEKAKKASRETTGKMSETKKARD